MSHFESPLLPVVIASTLKPVKDIRAYEKLALSLGETSKYQLNIIGFSDEKLPEQAGIRFFSSVSTYLSKIDRFLAPLRLAYYLFQIRPKLLICCTYELLPVAALLKYFLRYKLVYDVQENYRWNLDLNPTLTGLKKKLADKAIQWAEGVPGIDLFLLAEKCYRWEMPEKVPFLILENKHSGEIEPRSTIRFTSGQRIKFCITGTLSPFFGTVEGIRWFKKLVEKFPEIRLKIVGHCPLPHYLEEIIKEAEGLSQVQLEISGSPLPHEKMIQTLKTSDISLLPYRLNRCILDKMPTKLFECAALGLPVFITPNPVWEKFFSSYQGGYSVDFGRADLADFTFREALKQDYFAKQVPETVLWKGEKVHFQKAIAELLGIGK